MVRPYQLPSQLGDCFSLREAHALGVPRSRTRASDLVIPFRGVRALSPAQDVREAARQAMRVMAREDFAFSHRTAALLLGMPMPQPWSAGTELHVMVPTTAGRVRRAGIVGHRGLESRGIGHVAGLPVTDQMSTWVDLAPLLPVDDLVCLGDWLLRPGSALTVDDLRARLVRGSSLRLRQVLKWIRPGSASPRETLARLTLVRAGLPEPALNVDLVVDGEWIATVDLYWEEWGFALDYDGRHHRERAEQMDYDLDRARLIRRVAGVGFEQVTNKHLMGRHPQVVQIVREALVQRGWRPPPAR